MTQEQLNFFALAGSGFLLAAGAIFLGLSIFGYGEDSLIYSLLLIAAANGLNFFRLGRSNNDCEKE